MTKLTTDARSHIKGSNFALPGRRYPIEDASHARNALSRVSQFGSPAEKARVRGAVHRKYPGMGKSEPDADERGGSSDSDSDDLARTIIASRKRK